MKKLGKFSPFLHISTSFKSPLLQKLVRRLPNFFMEEGHWFVSVYNDDGDEHNVVLVPQNSQVALKRFSFEVKWTTSFRSFQRDA